jgi:hypothetical protein
MLTTMARDSRRTIAIAFAETLRDQFPAVLEHAQKLNSESVHITVWLVGLAGSLVAVLVARPESVARLSIPAQRYLLLLLLSTIVCAVVHRVLLHFCHRLAIALNESVLGHAHGYVAVWTVEEAESLNASWTREQIVQRLETEFGMNYRFLIELDATLDQCRDAYKSQFELQQRLDHEAFLSVADMLAAHDGKSFEEGRAIASRPTSDALEKIRKRAVTARRLSMAASVFFTLSSLSFVGAAATAIIGVMPALPMPSMTRGASGS